MLPPCQNKSGDQTAVCWTDYDAVGRGGHSDLLVLQLQRLLPRRHRLPADRGLRPLRGPVRQLQRRPDWRQNYEELKRRRHRQRTGASRRQLHVRTSEWNIKYREYKRDNGQWWNAAIALPRKNTSGYIGHAATSQRIDSSRSVNGDIAILWDVQTLTTHRIQTP